MAHGDGAQADRAAAAGAIGRAVVMHINSGAQNDEALWAAHWHPDFESVESDGSVWTGTAKVREKCEWWLNTFTVHACRAEGPYVTPNGFAVRYAMEIEAKDGSMPRTAMDEVGVYTVRDGKVVREEFFGRPTA